MRLDIFDASVFRHNICFAPSSRREAVCNERKSQTKRKPYYATFGPRQITVAD